jgi:hypothetical protein
MVKVYFSVHWWGRHSGFIQTWLGERRRKMSRVLEWGLGIGSNLDTLLVCITSGEGSQVPSPDLQACRATRATSPSINYYEPSRDSGLRRHIQGSTPSLSSDCAWCGRRLCDIAGRTTERGGRAAAFVVDATRCSCRQVYRTGTGCLT